MLEYEIFPFLFNRKKKCGRLDFGNCWDTAGTVRVYLDGQLVGEAYEDTLSKTIEFPIVKDSLLEIRDEGPSSIIRFNHFEMVECSGELFGRN